MRGLVEDEHKTETETVVLPSEKRRTGEIDAGAFSFTRQKDKDPCDSSSTRSVSTADVDVASTASLDTSKRSDKQEAESFEKTETVPKPTGQGNTSSPKSRKKNLGMEDNPAPQYSTMTSFGKEVDTRTSTTKRRWGLFKKPHECVFVSMILLIVFSDDLGFATPPTSPSTSKNRPVGLHLTAMSGSSVDHMTSSLKSSRQAARKDKTFKMKITESVRIWEQAV